MSSLLSSSWRIITMKTGSAAAVVVVVAVIVMEVFEIRRAFAPDSAWRGKCLTSVE